MFLSWVSKVRGAVGAEGDGVWGGVFPSPPGERSGKGAMPPPHNFILNFKSRNGVLWCILGVIFYSSAAYCTHVIRLYIGTYIWFGNGNKL